jgi:hypothetical protein
VEGKQEIAAYIGKYKSEIKEPRNYWVPTSFLMDYLEYVYWAIKHKDKIMQKQLMSGLKAILTITPQAKGEFWERALSRRPPRREIVERLLGN